MQKKGVVMQLAEGYAVVMTKEMEFRKIPLLEGMVVGLEVDVPAETVVPLSAAKSNRAWYQRKWMKSGVVAASILLAVGLFSNTLFTGPKAYAYVSVDINPSIELSIDNHKKVVTATPLNEDAEKLLTELKLTGIQIEEAVGKMADYAREHGYLHDKSEVIITASPAVDEQKLVAEDLNLDQIEDDLVASVQNLATAYGADIDVEGVRVSEEVRDAAKEAGVSPGKYAVYLSALSQGVDVDINELKNAPISKVVEQRGPEMAGAIDELKSGDQLDTLLKTLKKDGKEGLKQGAKASGVLPNNKSVEREDQKLPPGQQKKQDNATQSNDTKQQSNPSNDNQSSDRESNNGKSSKQDDKGKDGKSDDNNRNSWSFWNNWNNNDNGNKKGNDDKKSHDSKSHGNDNKKDKDRD